MNLSVFQCRMKGNTPEKKKKITQKKKICSTFSVLFRFYVQYIFFFFSSLYTLCYWLHITCICFSSSLLWTYSVTGLPVCNSNIQCIHFQPIHSLSLFDISIFTFVQKRKSFNMCIVCFFLFILLNNAQWP